MLADVLQRPLKVARRPEIGARGAAMAAMISLKINFDHDAWTRPEDEVHPNEDLADLYERDYGHYSDRVESARELWGR